MNDQKPIPNNVPWNTNTVKTGVIELAVKKFISDEPESQATLDARANWNRQVEENQKKSRKQADRWDRPLVVQVAPKLPEKLGPVLFEYWKQEVPFEEAITKALKERNAKTQKEINDRAEQSSVSKSPYAKHLPHGLYLVRMEDGKETECFKIERKDKLSAIVGKDLVNEILAELDRDLAKIEAEAIAKLPWYKKAWLKVKSFFKRGQL